MRLSIESIINLVSVRIYIKRDLRLNDDFASGGQDPDRSLAGHCRIELSR